MRAPPLKLLMTADAVGGVFPYALDLARALVPHGITTVLGVLGPAMDGGQRRAAAEVPGLSVRPLPLPLDWLAQSPRDIAAAAAALAEVAAEENVDVVQVNAPALAAADFPAPVVAVLHSCLASWWKAVKEGPLPADFSWRTRCLAKGLARADAVVCPSGAFADMAESIYGVRPDVVHNGRARPGADGGPGPDVPPFAFTAGRLWDEGKNIATLDAAAARMRLPLLAAGPLQGPHGARMDLRHAVAAGLLDEAGMRRRLSPRPVFLSAALYEPFGLAVLEAAQARCPLILADIPTFRELWDGAALFVPARDAEGFAAAADAVAADPLLHRRLGRAAFARAGRYSLAAMAAAMAARFRALAAPLPLSSTVIPGAVA